MVAAYELNDLVMAAEIELVVGSSFNPAEYNRDLARVVNDYAGRPEYTKTPEHMDLVEVSKSILSLSTAEWNRSKRSRLIDFESNIQENVADSRSQDVH